MAVAIMTEVDAQKNSTINQYENLQVAFPYLPPLDGAFYIEEPYRSNKIRRCKTMVFMGALSNYPPFRELETAQQNAIVRRMESACVNETIRKAREDNIGCSWQTPQFVQRYSNLVCEKATELDWTQNQSLVPRLIAGEVTAPEIARMTTDEANPNAARELLERSVQRREAKVVQKVSKAYPCPNCEARMATVQNVQTRGADEAKCTRATCLNCTHVWEVGR